MKQRVALARALAPNPRVRLMDEPFASLDALTREQLYGDIQEIWAARKKTILFVTHNVREAACLGNRVILFSSHPGRIREEFKIDLERTGDINSIRLASYSMEIMRALSVRCQQTAPWNWTRNASKGRGPPSPLFSPLIMNSLASAPVCE